MMRAFRVLREAVRMFVRVLPWFFCYRHPATLSDGWVLRGRNSGGYYTVEPIGIPSSVSIGQSIRIVQAA